MKKEPLKAKKRTEWKALAALVVLAVAFGSGLALYLHGTPRAEQVKSPVGEGLTGLRETTEAEPAAYAPLLSWNRDTQAVVYEIEFATEPDDEGEHRIYATRAVYTNHYNAPLREIAQILQPRFQRPKRRVVHRAVLLLAVAGDERDGVALIQKGDDIFDIFLPAV